MKRVAGIPGDTLAMVGGRVILNGKPVEQEVVKVSRRKAAFGPDGDGVIARERFPGEEKPHLILDLGPRPQDDFGPVTLPSGRYFLLGDNRDYSLDSRFPPEADGVGLATRETIVGKIEFRYWRSGEGLGSGGD